jgi:RNA polymerase sigma-70 factor (ECF subfamily)
LGLELALPPVVVTGEAAREERLRSMVVAHLNAVWRSLRRLGVPAAHLDDGVQQVFLVASRRLDEIVLGGERAYLLGIALRVAADARRAQHRRREVSMEGLASDQPAPELSVPQHPEEVLDKKRALAQLRACLDEMPQKYREAFILFELEELDAPEVARILRVPIGTVASRVRRARDRIRNYFKVGGAQ